MAKVKKAQMEIRDVNLRLSKLFDKDRCCVFDKEGFDKGQLDEITLCVVENRLRIYLQEVFFGLDNADKFLR